ncbi:MAG TPA: DUF6152 family protein [Paracoccaceae bacterium]|nr:DUF6152 family protein [Paracoccaceae bacterium]HMO70997.1 DUF6152 family protein [Paracoccaceae bacterium]
MSITRRTALAIALALPAGAAVAHHGWSWAVAEPETMEAVIETVSLAPPHPRLTVRAADGTQWTIDFTNPRGVERAGFREGSAAAGDAVTIFGNRARDPSNRLMKAIRITVRGQDYVFYPDRLPASN